MPSGSGMGGTSTETPGTTIPAPSTLPGPATSPGTGQ
jgi:hypothetical protein